MANIKIKPSSVLSVSGKCDIAKQSLQSTKNTTLNVYRSLNSQVKQRANIGGRLYRVSASLEEVKNQVSSIQSACNSAARTYRDTDDRLKRKAGGISTSAVANFTVAGTSSAVVKVSKKSKSSSKKSKSTKAKSNKSSNKSFKERLKSLKKSYKKKYTASQRQLIKFTAKKLFGKKAYKSTRIAYDFYTDEVDWETASDIFDLGVEFAEKSSPYASVFSKTIKNAGKYFAMYDKYEAAITEAVLDHRWGRAGSLLLEDVTKGLFGAVVDVGAQTIADYSIGGFASINDAVAFVDVATGFNAGVYFNHATAGVNSYIKRMFGNNI